MNEPTIDQQSVEPSEAVRLAEAAARAAEAEARKVEAEADKAEAEAQKAQAEASNSNKWDGLGCIIFVIAAAIVIIIGMLAKAGVFS